MSFSLDQIRVHTAHSSFLAMVDCPHVPLLGMEWSSAASKEKIDRPALAMLFKVLLSE
jgi:hypothetical protein